ncbi:aminoacyl-tRNA hydrolase [Malacoplasma muris]|uniref:aminoacyl-tRNA hydrolase n=1 Tax=Malacoplasma muris TaxID=2119 RepID=UPI00398F4F9C
MNNVYLIVGLGNPGFEYEMTKHNVGFRTIDKICNKMQVKLDKEKFNGLFTKISYKNNKEIILCKPLTYMNLSGECVKNIVNFFKISIDNIIIIYDDIDTNIGLIRVKSKGSSGGQNGMKNIISLLGTENIKRIRIGIGKPTNKNLANYVLSKFDIKDLAFVEKSIDNASQAAIDFVETSNFDNVISKYNLI